MGVEAKDKKTSETAANGRPSIDRRNLLLGTSALMAV